MGTYYNKLKALVESGRLSVFVIIAPPRSNSTVMEHILSISPDIQQACHEPFAAHKKGFEVENGYKQIYDSIGGQAFEDSGEQTSVVVKEMAHWLETGKEYENFLTLTNNPVVLLIRNPLLAVESRIRRTIKALDMRPSLSLNKLIDVLKHDKDFEDEAQSLFDSEIQVRNILEQKEIAQSEIEDLYSKPIMSIQNAILDYYSQKKGYSNWHDLIENKLYYERDYKFFEWFLQVNKNRLRFEENEFKNLNEIAQYLKRNDSPSIILDTTDVRMDPNNQLRKLCSKLGIEFSPEMINWGERPITIHTTQVAPYEHIWYEELYGSRELKPPTEIPPTLDMFPDFMQRYIVEANLPIYSLLSKEKETPVLERKEMNKKKLVIKVRETNEKYLRKLGVIRKEQVGENVLVELKYLDPVYAITNEPSLAMNLELRLRKRRYNPEIFIVSRALRRLDESHIELHHKPRLK